MSILPTELSSHVESISLVKRRNVIFICEWLKISRDVTLLKQLAKLFFYICENFVYNRLRFFENILKKKQSKASIFCNKPTYERNMRNVYKRSSRILISKHPSCSLCKKQSEPCQFMSKFFKRQKCYCNTCSSLELGGLST